MHYIAPNTTLSTDEANHQKDFKKILEEILSNEDFTARTKLPDPLLLNLRKYPATDQSIQWLDQALDILRRRRLYNLMNQIDDLRQEAYRLRSEYFKTHKVEAGDVICNKSKKRIKIYTDYDN